MERQYKDSGIEWIGKIPEEWSKDKVIRCFKKIGSGTTPKSTDDNLFIGNINWLQSGDINGGDLYEASKHISEQTLSNYSALSIYKAPFIIIAMYGASVGNISISHVDACVNQACCVLSGCSLCFNYVFFALKSAKQYLIYRAEGGGQPNISQDKLKTLWIPSPPLSEQQRIADYLDKKCGEIDSLIGLQEQMIEKLKDYKQSVITEAVTKGLDPNAKLVPSGIDWIGDIPEGWKVSQLKRFLVFQNGRDYKEIEVSEGFPVYGSGGIFAHASQYMYEGESILFGRKGTINKPLYINCKFWTVDTMYYTIPQKDVCAKFLYYVATTLPYDKYSTSTALPSMTQTILGNLKIVVPLVDEQCAIASYLDEKCSEIDLLIANKQQKIEKLKDYKKSVIYEAVTGKTEINDKS